MKVLVKLIDNNNAPVAQGFVDSDALIETHIVKRHGRTFAFWKMESFVITVFRECGPEFEITEF